MEPIFEKLQVLEIPAERNAAEPASSAGMSPETEGTETTEPLVSGEGTSGPQLIAPDDLVRRVIHRADQLRQEWVLP